MSNIVLNVITAALDTTVYGDIAGEIGRAIAGGDGVAEGVVELGRGRFEILFWYCASCSDIAGILLDRWMMLTFCGGIRCSNDFDVSKLTALL